MTHQATRALRCGLCAWWWSSCNPQRHEQQEALGAVSSASLSCVLPLRPCWFVRTGAPAFRTRFTTASKIVDPPPVAAHSFDAATLLLRAYAAAAPPKGGAQVGAALPRTRFPGGVVGWWGCRGVGLWMNGYACACGVGVDPFAPVYEPCTPPQLCI